MMLQKNGAGEGSEKLTTESLGFRGANARDWCVLTVA